MTQGGAGRLAWALGATALLGLVGSERAAAQACERACLGLLHEIDAVLERAPYGMTSGWSRWEDGMSNRIQWDESR